MAQYDIHRVGEKGMLVVDCQSDLLHNLRTRFVVLLLPIEGAVRAGARLNPVVRYADSDYLLVPQGAATVHVSQLGPKLGSLADYDLAIGSALDMLISGF